MVSFFKNATPTPRPVNRTALIATLFLLAGIGFGTLAAISIKLFLGAWIISIAVFLLIRSWQKPWLALTICVALYPCITIARPLYNQYQLPVFNSGVRCFPELIQLLILSFLLIRHSVRRTEDTRLSLYSEDLPVVAYLIVALYSVVIGCVNVHPMAPLNGWFVSITPAVFYLLIRWLRPTAAQKDHLVRTILAVYCVIAIPSLLDFFHRTDFGVTMANSERPYFVPDFMTPQTYWRLYPRLQSILWEEDYFAALSNIVLFVTIAHILYYKGRPAQYFVLILAMTCLILTISRAGYITFVIGATVLLVQRSPNRRMVLATIASLLVAGWVGLSSFSGTHTVYTFVERMETMTVDNAQSGELTSDRFAHWKTGIQTFILYPSGTGLGTAGAAASISKVATRTIGEGIFFRVLAEQGAIGLIGFVYMLVGTGWVLWRYLPVCDPVDRPLGSAMLAFHTGFVVHSAVASTFDYYFVVPVYWLLIGLFVSRTHQHLQKQTAATLPPPRYVPLLPARAD